MTHSLKVLAEDWAHCKRCGLGKERGGSDIVFGLGKPDARFLLIYDTPTEEDAMHALPMAGRDGNLLSDVLAEAGIDVTDVYCTPLLGCRPTVLIPETAQDRERIADRAPTSDELKACLPRIMEIIYRLDPEVIFTLGTDPYLQLVKAADRDRATTLDKAVGKLFLTRLNGRYLPEVTYNVIPLMSMKQIIAKPSTANHGPRATTIRHLIKGRAYADFVAKNQARDAHAAGH